MVPFRGYHKWKSPKSKLNRLLHYFYLHPSLKIQVDRCLEMYHRRARRKISRWEKRVCGQNEGWEHLEERGSRKVRWG